MIARVRMERVLSYILVALLVAMAAGCDRGDEQGTTTPTPVALEPCSYGARTKSPNAAGWGGKVAGISCKEAGQFIQDEFLPTGVAPIGQPSRHAPPPEKRGGGAVAGFDCQWRQYKRQPGWYHVACAREAQRFTFNLTP